MAISALTGAAHATATRTRAIDPTMRMNLW
jgi:hypothetical protein